MHNNNMYNNNMYNNNMYNNMYNNNMYNNMYRNISKKLIDLNRIILKFIRQENKIPAPPKESVTEFYKTLETTQTHLENTYYDNVMYPQLQNIWRVEKEVLLYCISCIIYLIMSHHVKYFVSNT
jgi:hypothetical protein